MEPFNLDLAITCTKPSCDIPADPDNLDLHMYTEVEGVRSADLMLDLSDDCALADNGVSCFMSTPPLSQPYDFTGVTRLVAKL